MRAGTTRHDVVLGHGVDPVALLAAHGWHDVGVHACHRDEAGRVVVEVDAVLGPRRPIRQAPVARDLDLELAPDEPLLRRQRLAAAVLVVTDRGLLATQYSDRTNREGQWGLPGGGVDPDEEPADAAAREAWEETGQRVRVDDLVLLDCAHWIGRAPGPGGTRAGGTVEDFHAVRLVYTGVCERPDDPVVHDVGGTTRDAAWVPRQEWGGLPWSPPARGQLTSLGLLPG